MNQQIRSFLISFFTVGIIFGTAAVIISYGRGYRFNFSDKQVNSTGLVVAQSDPSGAQIIVDGKVKTATQATLTLSPGWYTVSISKEGFQPWKKRVKVQGEVVTKIDALLLPVNPSLTAITVSGIVRPVVSPDGGKIAYIVPEQPEATMSGALQTTRPGIWVLDLVDKPLGLNRDARQIAQSNGIDFGKATLSWSPDSKQLLATLSATAAYLLETDKTNQIPLLTNIRSITAEWNIVRAQRMTEQMATVPQEFTRFATDSAKIIALSPDETKILYEATASATIPQIITPALIGTNPTEDVRQIKPGTIYVYDIKEDRNYRIAASQPAPVLHWLPSSRHLVTVSGTKIQIMDYDGENVRTAYAGPFWDSFAVPWASGGKIVIVTNLNSSASTVNNLYVVNLK